MLLSKWNEATCPERVELVFKNRNRDYGGYVIRGKYIARLVRSLVITISFVAILWFVYFVQKLIPGSVVTKTEDKTELVTLSEPPPIDRLMSPPPPLSFLPPPVSQIIKFTPPKIVRDEEVTNEAPPSQAELSQTQAGVVEQQENQQAMVAEKTVPEEREEEKTFSFVEEMPQFPGGEKKMIEYISSSLKYPAVALENSIEGKVIVRFMVDGGGKISNPEVLRGLSGGCNEEALRVVRNMPNWIPGKQNGKKVKVSGLILPIEFKLR